jgi:hypothetical protein
MMDRLIKALQPIGVTTIENCFTLGTKRGHRTDGRISSCNVYRALEEEKTWIEQANNLVAIS